jgi:hypothetical protein
MKHFGKRLPDSFFGAVFRMYYYETVIAIYISGDNPREFVRRFLPYSSSTTNVDSLVFSPGCCKLDAPLRTADNSRLEGLVSCNDRSSLLSTFFF